MFSSETCIKPSDKLEGHLMAISEQTPQKVTALFILEFLFVILKSVQFFLRSRELRSVLNLNSFVSLFWL